MSDARAAQLAHRVLVVLAGLAVAWSVARVGAGGLLGSAGGPHQLAMAFVLLAAVAVLRAWRFAGQVGDWVMATGLVSWAAGWVYWAVWLSPLDEPPSPSPADALWMAMYPLALVSLAWQVAAGAAGRGGILDILVGGAGVTAAIAGLVVPAIAPAGDLQLASVNAVYVGTNLAHIALLVGVIVGRALRVPRGLWLRLAGAVVLMVTNSLWLPDVVATGTLPVDTLTNLGWLAAFALMVASVGVPRPAQLSPPTAVGVVVVPVFGSSLALLVLLSTDTSLSGARWVAATAVALALARMAQAAIEALALTGAYRLARTDELTGLLNRRGVRDVLRRAIDDRTPATLLLLDLNRFKEINDTLATRQETPSWCRWACG